MRTRNNNTGHPCLVIRTSKCLTLTSITWKASLVAAAAVGSPRKAFGSLQRTLGPPLRVSIFFPIAVSALQCVERYSQP